MMYLSIELLIRIIVVLVVLLICFGIYVAINGLRENYRNKGKTTYLDAEQENWYTYFSSAGEISESLIPKTTREIQGVEEIFISYLKNVSDPTIKEKINQFSNKYLREHYLTLLRSKKWSIRINGLKRIANFEIECLEECQKFKGKNTSKEENFQLLKIFSFLNRENFEDELLNRSTGFSEYEFKKLFVSIDEELLGRIITNIEDLPKAGQYAFIDILGSKRDMKYLDFLESQLLNEHQEIRIRTLKAIHSIGVVRELEKYIDFVKSPFWEERLMMAKLLGNLPLNETASHFRVLLEDESWWVRSQAAKTIGKDKDGLDYLKNFSKTTGDKYAMEMANEILLNGGN
ncbi:hypothetical protein SAMN05518871_104226 [Psychrobacillus sp. OK028]|nr:hypothetical protein SAMN05518871_104226 [Psychrobacillus sp. OK028]